MVVCSLPRFPRASAGDASRRPFDDHERPFTVGVEEELMFLNPETLDLLPACGAALERLDDARFRSELPAAQLELAGNAPFHEGRDTGLHSVRPKLCESLPRQGVPPPLESWAAYRELLAWGAAGNAFPASEVWWEVRLHAVHGTVEVRVCDQPATAEESATLAAVVQALCAWLSMRHDAGGLGPPAPTVRIQENRWRALRHGLDGSFLDLDTGRPEPARERLAALLTTLEPVAAGLGSSEAFAGSWTMLEATGSAPSLRRPARRGGGAGREHRGRGPYPSACLGRGLSRPAPIQWGTG